MRVVGAAGSSTSLIGRAALLAALLCACGGRPSPEKPRPAAGDAPAADLCAERGGPGNGYVVVNPAERHQPAVERFSELTAGPGRPIEVCTFAGQYEYLVALRCDDGSQPFDSLDAARAARQGPIGLAGRCGNIVDRYAVKCPERTYEIHMDLYMCAQAELPETPDSLRVSDRGLTLRVPSGWAFAFDGPDSLDAMVRGPEGLRLGIGRAQVGEVSIVEVGPVFDALGEERPDEIESRSELSAGELLFFGRRDAIAVAWADAGDPGMTWLGVLVGNAESLVEHGVTALEVVASAVSSDHEYLDYGELVFKDVDEVTVVLTDLDEEQVLTPAGWTTITRKGAAVSRLALESGKSMSLVQGPSDEIGADSREIGNKLVQNLLDTRRAVTVAYRAFDEEDDVFRIVLDLSPSVRSALVVRKSVRGSHDLFWLSGPLDLLREHAAYVMLETIAAFELPVEEESLPR